MILAVDVGGDRLPYGFALVLNSIRKRFGPIVDYVSQRDLAKVHISKYRIVLAGFMFVTNYTELLPTLDALGIQRRSIYRDGPLVIAGGPPISENPEPVAEFIDVAMIGEAEWSILDVLAIVFRNRADKVASLAEIYETVDCAYVPRFYSPTYASDESVAVNTGRTVHIRRESPEHAYDIGGEYTRRGRGTTRTLEYSLEYHRGCKRRCRFCSYSQLQSPYREASQKTIHYAINEVAKRDRVAGNKIVMIQTNLFHMGLDTLELLALHNKLPGYSSACYADLFTGHGGQVMSFLRRVNNHMFMRFGIEDFTESGRKRLGKPITNSQLEHLPLFFDDRGRHVKFFFLSSLPWQTVSDIDEFEQTLARMSEKLTHRLLLEIYVTVINYKLNADMLEFPKTYSADVHDYLAKKMKKTYGSGKLQLKVFKNADEEAFLEVNLLALGNRKIGDVLDALPMYTRSAFVEQASACISTEGLLAPYPRDRMNPNHFIDYR